MRATGWIGAIACAATLATGAAMAAEPFDCGRWTVQGLRLGMTLAEARRVIRNLSPVEPERSDPFGRELAWSAALGQGREVMIATKGSANNAKVTRIMSIGGGEIDAMRQNALDAGLTELKLATGDSEWNDAKCKVHVIVGINPDGNSMVTIVQGTYALR